MTGFPDFWLHNTGRSLALLPLSWVYRCAIDLRRLAYRTGLLRRHAVGAPVLVVGNIFVGGTGKTPLVLWLARYLRSLGWSPGIITRGYGGQNREWPQVVRADSNPFEVGDEPVLLAERSGCPVVASPDRVEAARTALDTLGCNVVVSDDGLQHYRMYRDLEIVVIDAARGLGNGHCLPAGPLRESRRRLRRVDLLVANGGPSWLTPYYFTLRLKTAHNMVNDGVRELSEFADDQAHAVAGIGNPGRFFTALGRFRIEVIQHPFADHHAFTHKDIAFDDDLPVLMTEKDAVKCRGFAGEQHWSVPAQTVLTGETERALKARVRGALERFRTVTPGG
ncbi:MAG: tetraacyldisaccharide 4'-kinase [Ectothiorhodospiraceae bacterium]